MELLALARLISYFVVAEDNNIGSIRLSPGSHQPTLRSTPWTTQEDTEYPEPLAARQTSVRWHSAGTTSPQHISIRLRLCMFPHAPASRLGESQ